MKKSLGFSLNGFPDTKEVLIGSDDLMSRECEMRQSKRSNKFCAYNKINYDKRYKLPTRYKHKFF